MSIMDDKNFESIAIPWKERYNQSVINAASGGREVNLQFGKHIKLEKNKDGKFVIKKMTPFDAIGYIKELKDKKIISDGTSVVVTGNIEINSYMDKESGEVKRTPKLIVNYISGVKDINLETLTDEEEKLSSTFDIEVIVKEFYELENVTYMIGIIVGYDFIEEMEFKFDSEKLARQFKTLKPYTLIHVYGRIVQEIQEELVKLEDDPWSSDGIDYANKNTGKSKKVFVICKADGNSIDDSVYTEQAIEVGKKQLLAYKEDYKAGKDVSLDDFGDSSFDDINDEDFD